MPGYNPRSKPEWAIKFYNSTAWKRKREYIKQRYGYLCQSHRLTGGTRCKNIATEVHHIKDLVTHRELALDDANLLPLCRECHERTKISASGAKAAAEARAKGVRILKV